ncbi:uncharacterized protein E0L32_006828 [Thyridium curvatum]|uniref:Uncharacterized protein n=1 Tax=Thyridium curvatum TaxID=1093900 RepID=A0A507B015_9PEZI|nr:uncharacterized protein E0L32_006828 [Thyridium curvatum]TPX12416.1 hypothetical protein E0L32_006828 [Thyridium curvatum]
MAQQGSTALRDGAVYLMISLPSASFGSTNRDALLNNDYVDELLICDLYVHHSGNSGTRYSLHEDRPGTWRIDVLPSLQNVTNLTHLLGLVELARLPGPHPQNVESLDKVLRWKKVPTSYTKYTTSHWALREFLSIYFRHDQFQNNFSTAVLELPVPTLQRATRDWAKTLVDEALRELKPRPVVELWELTRRRRG